MRLVFCGTPEFAVPSLRALLADSRFRVEAVITQPDRPRGRGLAPAESAVKQLARASSLQIFQPEKIRAPEAQQWLEAKAPDAVVLIAYGQIIPARLLSIPRLGWINLHASLLPKYRGAAPIAWAIANGELRTGITTMQIDAGMDTGPILLHRDIEIGPNETSPELSARMAEAGAPLLLETLAKSEQGTLRPTPQENSQATYAPLLNRDHGRIRWEMSAREIYNRIRGFAPWPGTFADFRGKRLHLWGRPASRDHVPAHAAPGGTIVLIGGLFFVACGAGSWLQVTDVQPEGRRRMSAREFVSGARLTAGERLG